MKFRKIGIVAFLMIGFSVPAFAQNAVIPNQFHGLWDDDALTCEKAIEFGMPVGQGYEVTETHVNAYELYCTVNKVSSVSQNEINADLECMQEGEVFDEKKNLLLKENNLIIKSIEGGPLSSPLIKCN